MRQLDITERTFKFAVDVTKKANELGNSKFARRHLWLQLLRSGTSVGANVEEAQAAQSRADFIHKYSIALKEIRETLYWLKLLTASGIALTEDIAILTKEADEISRIIAQIIINTRENKK